MDKNALIIFWLSRKNTFWTILCSNPTVTMKAYIIIGWSTPKYRYAWLCMVNYSAVSTYYVRLFVIASYSIYATYKIICSRHYECYIGIWIRARPEAETIFRENWHGTLLLFVRPAENFSPPARSCNIVSKEPSHLCLF